MTERHKSTPEFETLFWSRVDRSAGPDACWLFRGSINKRNGYGYFSHGRGTQMRAHRAAYALTYGTIPPELCVCHRCDTPACVNPAHLFLGTHADNSADKVTKGRSLRGERNPSAKLNAQIVALILASNEPRSVLATRYGVTPQAISLIRTRRKWAHVEGPNAQEPAL